MNDIEVELVTMVVIFVFPHLKKAMTPINCPRINDLIYLFLHTCIYIYTHIFTNAYYTNPYIHIYKYI